MILLHPINDHEYVVVEIDISSILIEQRSYQLFPGMMPVVTSWQLLKLITTLVESWVTNCFLVLETL